MRQGKLGELCCLATVSRPDICATLARIAPQITSLRSVDVFRINDLVKTVREWQPATVSKNFAFGKMDQGSSARPRNDERHCKEKIHGDAMALVGWSDASYEDQSSLGTCRLGYNIGLMSPNLRGPRHLI